MCLRQMAKPPLWSPLKQMKRFVMRNTGIDTHEANNPDLTAVCERRGIDNYINATPHRHKQVLPVPEEGLVTIGIRRHCIFTLTRRVRFETRNHVHIVNNSNIAV